LESNKKAILILLMLVLAAVIILFMENKFLVAEQRGSTISHYQNIPWFDNILFLAEDFEGFANDSSSTLQKERLFVYGSIKFSLDHEKTDHNPISAKAYLQIEWNGNEKFGGWGKGVGAKLDLDANNSYLTFRIYVPEENGANKQIKIILEEDDNDDGILQKDMDDTWYYLLTISGKDEWQQVSVPLKDFKDENTGGDHIFNVTSKGGLHTLIFSFENPETYKIGQKWFFDFICFTNEKVDQPK
jgi:hypothetical protein